jgi:hypothetical protein|tara:strand:- start:170 stop:592 length:423 start_codon:yes stop_codon:yes gene_type:complete
MRRNRKTVTLVDSYKEYIEENPELNIYKKDYKNICIRFNELLCDEIITNAEEVTLPSRLGTLRIKKVKGSGKRVDWAATKEHNKKIYHLNLHTDEYYFRWHWSKKKALFANKSVYSFTPLRKHKRKLAGLLKNNNVEFFN